MNLMVIVLSFYYFHIKYWKAFQWRAVYLNIHPI